MIPTVEIEITGVWADSLSDKPSTINVDVWIDGDMIGPLGSFGATLTPDQDGYWTVGPHESSMTPALIARLGGIEDYSEVDGESISTIERLTAREMRDQS